jgi:hypothetical protein
LLTSSTEYFSARTACPQLPTAGPNDHYRPLQAICSALSACATKWHRRSTCPRIINIAQRDGTYSTENHPCPPGAAFVVSSAYASARRRPLARSAACIGHTRCRMRGLRALTAQPWHNMWGDSTIASPSESSALLIALLSAPATGPAPSVSISMPCDIPRLPAPVELALVIPLALTVVLALLVIPAVGFGVTPAPISLAPRRRRDARSNILIVLVLR